MLRKIIASLTAACSFILLGVDAHAVEADTTKLPRVRYFNQLLAGPMTAKEPFGLSASTTLVQGVRIGTFSAGVGLGIDAYREWQTIPVSTVLTLDVATSDKLAFYLQMAIGRSSARNPALDDLADQGWARFHFDGRGMFNPALGFRIPAGNWRLYMVAGYKSQRVILTEKYNGGHYTEVKDYKFERFCLQIGFGIN